MDKIFRKLIAAFTMLAILLVLVITVSYAWFTISLSPEVQGISISLGGGNTILIAPNQTQIANGGIYHYPGKFSQTLHFNQYDQYDYLNAIGGLSPVSTADGLHWYIPTYYEANDKEVINGEASVGQVKPIEEFLLDSQLSHANVTNPKAALQGSYVYLDFWVVSPGVDYELRIAQGDESAGSFLIELMKPTDSGDGEYELVETLGSVAASARIGFLVNHDTIMDDTMLYYAASGNCPSAYTSLRGEYQEMGDNILYSSNYVFTIYEPNGDLHPDGENGTYVETRPLAWTGGGVVLADIQDRLTVQLSNYWSEGVNSEYYIQEAFKAAIAGKSYSSADDVWTDFYQNYLQRQVHSYVNKGNFITSTAALYNAMTLGTVSQESLNELESSGATEDICIAHLEKNIPQRIRMFVWLEGQDADCKEIQGTATFALGIELAGSQIAANEKTRQED